MAEKNKPKLGSGKRFSDLVEKLKKKGIKMHCCFYWTEVC